MTEKLNLFWFKLSPKKGNFGDELNPYIVGHLTGGKINHWPIAGTRSTRIFELIKRIILHRINLKSTIQVIRSLTDKEYYICIGSTIAGKRGNNCKIWGAGLMDRDDYIDNCTFYAVRGKITKKRIEELGYIPPKAIGDPALLLPLIYKPQNSIKKFKLGLIPHFLQYQELSQSIEMSERIHIIDLLNNPEKVVEDINSCEMTISSSLHGIIVSHAYGVPSLWGELGKTKISGDDVKFEDYFSSVGITKYKKINIDMTKDIIVESKTIFTKYKNQSVVESSLVNSLQKGLIESTPFEILDKYKSIFH